MKLSRGIAHHLLGGILGRRGFGSSYPPRPRHRETAGKSQNRLSLMLWGTDLDMTASEMAQGSGEPVDLDTGEIEREGIARVIYVLPAALAVERGARTGEAESTVEPRNGA
jgi:hypothetical protein